MVQLIVSGKTICFNLNDRGREKRLFETWYAMSDIPKYLNKRINIVTDKNEHLSYTIAEIKDCTFIDKDYIEEPIPDVSYPKNLLEELMCTKEDIAIDSLSVGNLLDTYFPSKSILTQDIKNILTKYLGDLPKKTLNKLFLFARGILDHGYFIEPNCEIVNKIILELLESPDDEDVDKYINMYIEYCKQKKSC